MSSECVEIIGVKVPSRGQHAETRPGNRSEQQNREQDELPLKVLELLRTGLVEKDVDELIEVLRNIAPNRSNYGPGAVADVKTPTKLYKHMSQKGDIRVRGSRSGDVTCELLIEALEQIGQKGLACDLDKAIQQYQASMKSLTSRRSMSSTGSARSNSSGSTPMTPSDRMIEMVGGDGGVVSWTGQHGGGKRKSSERHLDDIVHNNEPPSKRKKARKEEVDRYNLTCMGLVAVINNFADTKHQNARLGTIKDENEIVKLFSEEPFGTHYELFDYDVTDSSDYANEHNRDLDNKAMNEYLDKLKDHLEKNKDEYSSFILFIMSHGSKKGVAPYPGHGKQEDEIPVEDIMKRFEDVLVDKPKVIVIQACKGNEHNRTLKTDNCGQSSGVGEVESDTSYRPYIPPPKGADMLVAYSTINGYKAYRYEETGSVYIQSLMKHIAENNKASGSKHLGDILTRVHADVSQWKEDITDKGDTHKDVRQMPYYQSSFRSNFFLLPFADGLS